MGVGVPYAVGAKIAQPDRLVIAVCGDMGFALTPWIWKPQCGTKFLS